MITRTVLSVQSSRNCLGIFEEIIAETMRNTKDDTAKYLIFDFDIFCQNTVRCQSAPANS